MKSLYHESVPRHGRKKTIEQNIETQLINNPVITVTVDNGLVKVKNHYNSSHCKCARQKWQCPRRTNLLSLESDSYWVSATALKIVSCLDPNLKIKGYL